MLNRSLLMLVFIWMVISLCFFFSSRRRHTRFKCDWSSDVCSSDLASSEYYVDDAEFIVKMPQGLKHVGVLLEPFTVVEKGIHQAYEIQRRRSEERRVGKECRYRWSRYNEQKKNKKPRI